MLTYCQLQQTSKYHVTTFTITFSSKDMGNIIHRLDPNKVVHGHNNISTHMFKTCGDTIWRLLKILSPSKKLDLSSSMEGFQLIWAYVGHLENFDMCLQKSFYGKMISSLFLQARTSTLNNQISKKNNDFLVTSHFSLIFMVFLIVTA